jgi:20S proteasome alpha/beta subunit
MIDLKSASHSKKLRKKNKRDRIRKREHEGQPMTVCVAAIAEMNTSYPKIVIAADREVTTDWISYTSGVGKIRELTKYCWVMISTNNALVSNDIISKSIERLNLFFKDHPDEKLAIEQIVELISQECKFKLDIERERFVLSPHGLSYDSYIEKSKNISREHIEIITDDLKEFESYNYNFRAEFLVFGIDTTPHIFTIVQNGQYVSSDFEGFAIIGGGKSTAFPEFTKYLFRPDLHWLTVLHRVYTSKKVAERVGGVGPDTDLIVFHMTEEGDIFPWQAYDDTKLLLDASMKKVRDAEIAIYSKSLERYNDLLLSSQPEPPPNEEK